MFFLSSDYIRKLRAVFGLQVEQDTELEAFLKSKYTAIPNIAYQQKRRIKDLDGDDVPYNIYLNELITPDAWMVQNLMRGVSLTDQVRQRVRNTGNKVAQTLTWTDDKNLATSGDYYLYPNESLALKKCDCEDHAYVFGSCLPEDLGLAWGFYKTGGHCYNVFLDSGNLWVADTVGDEVNVVRYDTQADYKINYIVTRKYTFVIDGTVQFGELAGWHS